MSLKPVYRILHSDDPSVLANQVNRLIKEGYEPHGSLIYNHCHEHTDAAEYQHYYVQAMVLDPACRNEVEL